MLCTSNSEPLLWRLAACLWQWIYFVLQIIFSMLLSSPPTRKTCSSFHTALQFWNVHPKSWLWVSTAALYLPLFSWIKWLGWFPCNQKLVKVLLCITLFSGSANTFWHKSKQKSLWYEIIFYTVKRPLQLLQKSYLDSKVYSASRCDFFHSWKGS